MKKIVFTFWDGLQKIVALVIMKISGAKKIGIYKEANLYYWKWQGGMSLSNKIFLPFEKLDGSKWQYDYVKHEYGHSIQSKILGHLYLLVIGLPSLLWAWLGDKYREKYNKSCYDFYTEPWVNKLGGAYQDE